MNLWKLPEIYIQSVTSEQQETHHHYKQLSGARIHGYTWLKLQHTQKVEIEISASPTPFTDLKFFQF